ncbi:MAG: type II/IV secretion system protein, partial [Candidatus Saccharimonas sp.]
MRISDETLTKLLTSNTLATEVQLSTLREQAASASSSLQDAVLQARLITEADLTKLFAQYADLPYIEINPNDIPSDTLNRIPERIARQYNAVIFKIDPDGLIHLAMDDPDDVQAVSFIEKEIGENVK